MNVFLTMRRRLLSRRFVWKTAREATPHASKCPSIYTWWRTFTTQGTLTGTRTRERQSCYLKHPPAKKKWLTLRWICWWERVVNGLQTERLINQVHFLYSCTGTCTVTASSNNKRKWCFKLEQTMHDFHFITVQLSCQNTFSFYCLHVSFVCFILFFTLLLRFTVLNLSLHMHICYCHGLGVFCSLLLLYVGDSDTIWCCYNICHDVAQYLPTSAIAIL